jgi:multiple sugar transport system substrate-binding protein
MTVKAVFASLAALGALVVLAPPPPPEQHDPKRQKVVFWHMWGNEYQPVVEATARRFNESQTQYEVVPVFVPAGGAETKFLLSASGGKAPDLVSQWNPVLGMWSDRGLIRPLGEIMSPEEEARFRREAYPIMQLHATYKGQLMAMIAGIDTYALYYRLDHLKEVGLDENHLPQTLEEVQALGEKLDRKDSNGRLTRVGFLPQYWSQLVPSFGGGFGDGLDMKFDTEANRQAVEFAIGNQKRLGFDRVQRFLSAQAADTGASAPLIAGNYSILLDGQWRVKQTAEFAPKLSYCVAPLPPPKGGKPLASTTDANYLVIPRAASCPQGAWAFMKYWLGMDDPEAGGRNVGDMGWLPYCDRVAHSASYQDYLRKYPKFRPFLELVASPNLTRFPVSPLQSFASGELNKAIESTNHGTLTPDAALQGLDRTVAGELARQRRLGTVR